MQLVNGSRAGLALSLGMLGTVTGLIVAGALAGLATVVWLALGVSAGLSLSGSA